MASSLGSYAPMVLSVVTGPLLPSDRSLASCGLIAARGEDTGQRTVPQATWRLCQASFRAGGLQLFAELTDCRQPLIWLHVQDALEITSASHDRVDGPFGEDGQCLQCCMTRLLRFVKLRQRRGEIEAGKRSVGWPSTRPSGSVVQAD